jgi:ElaB/YqjD/DUF883 family membrane-anchored ribosome-binding protein
MVAAGQEATAGSAAGVGDDVVAQIGRLQDEVSALKQTIAGFGTASGGACNCSACADAARQLAQHAKHDAQAAIADLEAFARRNPRYVIGGALGVGFVLGLLRRRH